MWLNIESPNDPMRFLKFQELQQITLSASLTMIEVVVIAGCAHTAEGAI